MAPSWRRSADGVSGASSGAHSGRVLTGVRHAIDDRVVADGVAGAGGRADSGRVLTDGWGQLGQADGGQRVDVVTAVWVVGTGGRADPSRVLHRLSGASSHQQNQHRLWNRGKPSAWPEQTSIYSVRNSCITRENTTH